MAKIFAELIQSLSGEIKLVRLLGRKTWKRSDKHFTDALKCSQLLTLHICPINMPCFCCSGGNNNIEVSFPGKESAGIRHHQDRHLDGKQVSRSGKWFYEGCPPSAIQDRHDASVCNAPSSCVSMQYLFVSLPKAGLDSYLTAYFSSLCHICFMRHQGPLY